MDVERTLEGAWTLESMSAVSSEGLVYPFGKDARGRLAYAGGRVSVHIVRPDRPRFAANQPLHVAGSGGTVATPVGARGALPTSWQLSIHLEERPPGQRLRGPARAERGRRAQAARPPSGDQAPATKLSW